MKNTNEIVMNELILQLSGMVSRRAVPTCVGDK
jgi:hypothetical protein